MRELCQIFFITRFESMERGYLSDIAHYLLCLPNLTTFSPLSTLSKACLSFPSRSWRINPYVTIFLSGEIIFQESRNIDLNDSHYLSILHIQLITHSRLKPSNNCLYKERLTLDMLLETIGGNFSRQKSFQ